MRAIRRDNNSKTFKNNIYFLISLCIELYVTATFSNSIFILTSAKPRARLGCRQSKFKFRSTKGICKVNQSALVRNNIHMAFLSERKPLFPLLPMMSKLIWQVLCTTPFLSFIPLMSTCMLQFFLSLHMASIQSSQSQSQRLLHMTA